MLRHHILGLVSMTLFSTWIISVSVFCVHEYSRGTCFGWWFNLGESRLILAHLIYKSSWDFIYSIQNIQASCDLLLSPGNLYFCKRLVNISATSGEFMICSSFSGCPAGKLSISVKDILFQYICMLVYLRFAVFHHGQYNCSVKCGKWMTKYVAPHLPF